MDFNSFNYLDSFTQDKDGKVNFKRNRISSASRPVPATNSGGAMLIIVFVVLCLTVFGFLAFSTAFADRKLTDKNIKNQAAFYAADSKAELKIAQIYELFYNYPTKDPEFEEIAKLLGNFDVISNGSVDYDSESGLITVDFITDQDDSHAIYTCAEFYVNESGNWDYKITSWFSYYTDDLDYSHVYDVWSGE